MKGGRPPFKPNAIDKGRTYTIKWDRNRRRGFFFYLRPSTSGILYSRPLGSRLAEYSKRFAKYKRLLKYLNEAVGRSLYGPTFSLRELLN